MNADLHCHSTVSDGLLSPAAVARRAAQNGVNLWALTDHDELSGLAEARQAAQECGMIFINGVEISASFDAEQSLHIVGLGIDCTNPVLLNGLRQVRSGRDQRAQRIGVALAEAGIPDAYQGALKYADNPALVGRSHFARYLVEQKICRNMHAVFEHWLTPGKPGFVPHSWASVENVIAWIHAAGGRAVLAHPCRYPAFAQRVDTLVALFKAAQGDGLEVVSGLQDVGTTRKLARLAVAHDLLASRASDFHGDEGSTVEPGKIPALPAGVKPIWEYLH